MSNTKQIEEATEFGYEFRISHYFSKAFEFFKDRAGEFIGFTLVYIIISVVNSFIPVVGTLISLAITGPLSLGAMIFAHRMHTNQALEFSNFFDGFKKFTPVFATYILQVVIYLILAIPIFLIVGFDIIINYSSGDPEVFTDLMSTISANTGLFFGVFVVFIYVVTSLRWSLHLAYFHDYTPINAIKQSFYLVNKKWFHHLFFLFLCVLIICLGFLALLVGIIVAIPIIAIADYIGYSDITGLGKEESSDLHDGNMNEVL